MTAQEQQMLQGLIERVNKTQLADKDADAEQMLAETLGHNPDALYILAQTVLVQGYALEQAQKQLADARAQMEQMRQQSASGAGSGSPQRHGSFLGNLLGLDRTEPQRPGVAPPPPPAQSGPQYAPVPAYGQTGPAYAPGYAPVPAYGYAPPMGYGGPGFGGPMQSGGFLRSAMQTATGVAAGALAFEGIESLMHGFGHAAGYGSGFGGSGFGGSGLGELGGTGAPGRPEEVINNYYGDASPGGEHGAHERSDYLDSGASGASSRFDASPADATTARDASSSPGSDGGRDFASGGMTGADPDAGGLDAGAGFQPSDGYSAGGDGSEAGSGFDGPSDDSSSGDSSSYDTSGDSGGGFDSGGGDDGGGGF